MSRPLISRQATTVWLLVRDEGGYWSAAEVAEHLGLPRAGRGAVAQYLRALAAHSHVRRQSAASGATLTYGVTAKCHPVDGYTLQPST